MENKTWKWNGVSRKKDIETIASLVGNSAAHIALLPESEFALKEATTYTEDAAEIASSRSWNAKEIQETRSKALKRAKSELRKRIPKYGLNERDSARYEEKALGYINKFIKENMETQ